ncbi:MAG: hypothetical protein JNN08_03670 [Bryobacterales bacterium]|nr:hypothetical protein [Bryobacterales bacterium]
MMKFLGALVRALHCTIGITPPPAEQESLFVFVWFGIGMFLVAGFVFLLYLPSLLR